MCGIIICMSSPHVCRAQDEQLSLILLLLWLLWKSILGDTRIWTMDLSDCSRLLYHWAISPRLLYVDTRQVTFVESHLTLGATRSAQRRWYNGQHSCLPSSWSGFDSRPTQYFSCLIWIACWAAFANKNSKVLSMRKLFSKSFPLPGIEPGPPGWEPGILTTRP